MKKRDIAICKFTPDEYGAISEVAITDVESFREYLWKYPVYSTDYYSVFLVVKGVENITVNGVSSEVRPGMILCSRPGEIWQWEEDTKIEGEYLYWTEPFLDTFFNDPHFIDRFSYFNISRNTSFLYPAPVMFRQILSLFRRMRQEITNGVSLKINESDCHHMLRALVYETLMLLDRIEHIPVKNDNGESLCAGYVMEFQRLVKENIQREHSVEYYAGRMFITSNYLNKIVKTGLGISTKKYLKKSLVEEAVKLLQYTGRPINEIADMLHLDSIYFIKLFRQEMGITPLQYRKDNQPK